MPTLFAPAAPAPNRTRWDVFCRVIDNFGDIGVCWRLATELARRGLQVRLFCDDTRALSWMAPQGHAAVQVVGWPLTDDTFTTQDVADVVIEAFGCDPPPAYVQAMAQRPATAPVWVNLEYLSAEDYVERSHSLPSPQPCGLKKWFFFPGFTARTGGLLREDGLPTQQAAFDSTAWLAQHGVELQAGERAVSLFCYPTPLLPALAQALAEKRPTVLLLTPGAARNVEGMAVPGLRTHALPWLTQTAFDQLLWACDLNFVRGEDSLVRAIWAGKPWVWQAYPQHDGAHHGKVQALLDRWQPAADVAALWHWWNGAQQSPTQAGTLASPPPLPALAPWRAQVLAWRQALQLQPSLVDQLVAFVHSRSGPETAPPARI